MGIGSNTAVLDLTRSSLASDIWRGEVDQAPRAIGFWPGSAGGGRRGVGDAGGGGAGGGDSGPPGRTNMTNCSDDHRRPINAPSRNVESVDTVGNILYSLE